jgi:caa(3)-type oxidase subunit IV
MAHDTTNSQRHDEETHAHTVPPTSQTLMVFAVLALLSLVALGIGFSDIGPIKVLASLACATVQMCVLGYFFMELKQADKLTWLVVASSFFFTGLQFVFTLTDYLTRHLGVL